MKYRLYRYYILIILLSVITCLSTCYVLEQPIPPRSLSCEMPADYNYLDFYERWSDSICTTELCSLYTTIWKELLIDRTTLTEPYFNDHFEITSSEIREESNGDYFIIGFRVQNDWAIAYSGDRFIIRIVEGAEGFPEIGLPKGEYLGKEEIAAAVEHKGYESYIDNIPKTGLLKYSTRDEALQVLINEIDIDTLCFYRITLDINRGTLTLNAFAQYDDTEDECIEGSIDLITGQVSLQNKTCSDDYER